MSSGPDEEYGSAISIKARLASLGFEASLEEIDTMKQLHSVEAIIRALDAAGSNALARRFVDKLIATVRRSCASNARSQWHTDTAIRHGQSKAGDPVPALSRVAGSPRAGRINLELIICDRSALEAVLVEAMHGSNEDLRKALEAFQRRGKLKLVQGDT